MQLVKLKKLLVIMNVVGKKRHCIQSEHDTAYLLDHNNVWYCKKCKNILFYNGRRLIVQTYDDYVKFSKKRKYMKTYSKEEIIDFINKNT